MTIDKRSVSTDALETLGMIIDETQKRDAIHLAVEPVFAKERLHPGDHVNANGEKCMPYENGAVGIVDPFLKMPNCLQDNSVLPVLPGERFWLVLYPRTIKSLRHVWEHPAFPTSEVQIEEINEKVGESVKWIEDYANEIQKSNGIIFNRDYDDICDLPYKFDYNYLMDAADSWISSNNDDYLSFGTTDYKEFNEEFWYHYEIIRGIKLEENKKKDFFTCAC